VILHGVLAAKKASPVKGSGRGGRLTQAERRAARGNVGDGPVLKEFECRFLRGISSAVPVLFGPFIQQDPPAPTPSGPNAPVITTLHGIAIKNFPHEEGAKLTHVGGANSVMEYWCITNFTTTKGFGYEVLQALTVENSIAIDTPEGQAAP